VKYACALLVSLCTISAASAGPDSLVQAIVNSVSQDSIRATIQRLQGFGTRYNPSESNYAAVHYAQGRMMDYACDTVYLHQFDTSGYLHPSVIGVKRGRLHPNIEYIICGHIDDAGSTHDSAPGADDDASGISVVLEACRVFAQHWFNYTVRFACFNSEEGGGYGASLYAYEARQRGDSILGVLNFDMVGYGPEGHDSVTVAACDSNPNCLGLQQQWCFAADAYTALKYRPFPCRQDSFIGFDHYGFLVNGYKALLVEEAQNTPEYHRIGDTLGPLGYESCGVNNLPLLAEVAKAAVASLAILAQTDGIAGIQERPDHHGTSARCAILARGVLLLPGAVGLGSGAASLLDVSGRRVMGLQAGANDVRALAPGVYFVRKAQAQAQAEAVRKVVVTR
jgi:hypothetical protein